MKYFHMAYASTYKARKLKGVKLEDKNQYEVSMTNAYTYNGIKISIFWQKIWGMISYLTNAPLIYISISFTEGVWISYGIVQ